MDSSDKLPEIPPQTSAYSHRPPFHHHDHHHDHHHLHHCLEPSPHCPQHGASAHGHHHQHLQLSPDCPLHGHLLPPCQLHTSNFNPNNQCFPIIPNFPSIPLPRNPNYNSIPPEAEADANTKSEALIEEEDEDEFIFVLTDEWKDFFAKSEAKRRFAKKQPKRKGKGKD